MARVENIFHEDFSEIVSAYFDGEKIFIVRLTKKFETVEIDTEGLELEQLAEKISLICRERGWKTSAVGFCLREEDALTFQTEVANIPEKDIPAMVRSWATAQAGAGANFSFVRIGEEIWMETIPHARVKEICAAFNKFSLNLRALSAMPANRLSKIHPFDRTEFISEVVRESKAPNLLAARSSIWNWKRISLTAAAIFSIVLVIVAAKLFIDYHVTSSELDEAKISVDEMHEDIALKREIDADIAELHRINQLAAQVHVSQNLNLLINLGKISNKSIRLTKIRAEDKFLEIEGVADNPAAVKNYLARVKDFVIKSARLESSFENDDGEIVFTIRAAFGHGIGVE